MYILWADTEDIRELFHPSGLVPPELADSADVLLGAISEIGDFLGVAAASDLGGGTVQINWLLVREEQRRKGIGTALLQEMIGLLSMPGAGCDEAVVSYTLRSGYEAMDSLFEEHGFEKDQDVSVVYREPLSFFGSFVNQKSPDVQFEAIPLKLVGRSEWSHLCERLAELRAESMKEGELVLDPLYIVPEDKASYDQEISFVMIDEKGKPAGCILETVGERGIFVDYLCVFPERPVSDMVGLLAAAIKEASKRYDPSMPVMFNAVNKRIISVVRMIGHKKPKEYTKSVSWVLDF